MLMHFLRLTIENFSKLCFFFWNGKDFQLRLAEKRISWSHDLQGHKQKVWLSRRNQSLSLKTAENSNNGAVDARISVPADIVRCIMLHPYIVCLEIMRHKMYKSITNDIDTSPILVLDHSRWCFRIIHHKCWVKSLWRPSILNSPMTTVPSSASP